MTLPDLYKALERPNLWEGATHLVTHTGHSRTGLPYVVVRACQGEEHARAMMADRRAHEPTLWLLAPTDYLGPCLVPYLTVLGSNYVPSALQFKTTEGALHFQSLGDHVRGGSYNARRVEDIGPIFAEQREIDVWRDLMGGAK